MNKTEMIQFIKKNGSVSLQNCFKRFWRETGQEVVNCLSCLLTNQVIKQTSFKVYTMSDSDSFSLFSSISEEQETEESKTVSTSFPDQDYNNKKLAEFARAVVSPLASEMRSEVPGSPFASKKSGFFSKIEDKKMNSEQIINKMEEIAQIYSDEIDATYSQTIEANLMLDWIAITNAIDTNKSRMRMNKCTNQNLPLIAPHLRRREGSYHNHLLKIIDLK